LIQSCAKLLGLADLSAGLMSRAALTERHTFTTTLTVELAALSQSIASFFAHLENHWSRQVKFTNGKFVYRGEDAEVMPTDVQPIFFLGQAMYVPHYLTPHLWVSYGGATLTTRNLIERNAKIGTTYLWNRPWIDKIFKGKDIFAMKNIEIKGTLTK
jgi:hypothetical protein